MFNSRKDLDAAPADQREKFIGLLAASINKWSWDGSDWVLEQVTTEIEKFGFDIEDFEDAPIPEKPDYNPEQKALDAKADEVRAQRDALLSDCDWTQVADAPVDKAAWADYRQALRDVPQQQTFPEEVVWPTKP